MNAGMRGSMVWMVALVLSGCGLDAGGAMYDEATQSLQSIQNDQNSLVNQDNNSLDGSGQSIDGQPIDGQSIQPLKATLNHSSYYVNQVGRVTLTNTKLEKIYLPGCEEFHVERLEKAGWKDLGPNKVCFWEGLVRPLAPKQSRTDEFALQQAGMYRLKYLVGFGCEEHEPMSQADCRDFQVVYTKVFRVLAGL